MLHAPVSETVEIVDLVYRATGAILVTLVTIVGFAARFAWKFSNDFTTFQLTLTRVEKSQVASDAKLDHLAGEVITLKTESVQRAAVETDREKRGSRPSFDPNGGVGH